MASVEDLQAYLAKLRAIRANGVREVEYEGRRVSYRDDAELQAAILDLERQIAMASRGRVDAVVFSTSKGL